jgi:hypothetical protein
MIFKNKNELTKEVALKFLAEQELSMEEIAELGMKTLGTLFTNERVSRQDEFQIFDEISKIEGIENYLRDTMARDVKRYFTASDDHGRDQVRGAYARTMYWRSLLNRKDVNDTPSRIPPIGADRYGSGSD